MFISGLAAPFKKSVQVKSSSAAENPTQSLVLCDVCCEKKCATVKSCLICLASYCKTHLEPHEIVLSFKKHKLMEPVENLEDYICQKHERPLELFCRDDQTCVCQFCTEGDHKTHNTVPIEEESGEKKIQMKRTVAKDQEKIHEQLKKIKENQTKKLKRIQRYAVDVTLDPDTANPYLILSDDGKQFTDGDTEQNLPDNPERFTCCPCLLGKQGFSSGRFYYEVQVRGKTEWDLGVARESINRKGEITVSPEDGFWCVN